MLKKMIIVILGILLPSVASAQNFLIDYFPVKVYGDVESYRFIFNGVAMIFNNQIIMSFITNVVPIIAFVVIIWKLVFRSSSAQGGEAHTPPWEMFFKQFTFLCIIMLILLNPTFKSTVTIEDQRFYYGAQTGGTAGKAIVDNVPTILAFSASASSYLGYALVQVADSAFANIQGARYSDIGFLENFTQLREDRRMRFEGQEKAFSNLYQSFVTDCALRYQHLTSTPIEGIQMGRASLESLDPATWNPQLDTTLYTQSGYTCEEAYQLMMTVFGKIEKNWENRAIKSMGLNPATATPALEAMANSVLAAPTNVAGHASNMSPFIQYKLRASLEELVGDAIYADSLGVTGAYGQYINQNVREARAKMTDVTNQSKFIFSLKSFPQTLHFLIAVIYAIFPLTFIVAAIKGYPSGLKSIYYFSGGLLSLELIRMSLAIVHGLVTEYTSANAAQTLHAMAAGAVNMNEVVHSTAYYEYMATQAEFAATMGIACIFIIPIVVITGQVKMLSAIMQSANAAPQMGGIEGGASSMAKANDADNRDLSTVAHGWGSAAIMKGIEENNAAIASLSKMDNYNDFNKGQVGQQMQQIGATAGYGGEMRSASDFRLAESGGKFQGVQSAANVKHLGDTFEGTHNFRDRAGISGDSLARALGNDAGLKTTSTARALMAGDFFTRDGNISGGGREGNLYAQGLENQARISANQAAGLGKMGEFSREEMNAIQYGSHAQGINQIAQGRSLGRTYGRGDGFQSNYDRMAETSADMQNITARESASSARAHFSGISGGKGGDSFANTTRLKSDAGFEDMLGTTDAYAEARNTNSNIAREQSKLGALSNYKGTQAKLDNIDAFNHNEAISQLSSASASMEGKKAFMDTQGFNALAQKGVYNENGSINKEANITDGRGKEHSYANALREQSVLNAGQDVGSTLSYEGASRQLANKMIDENKDKINQLESQKHTGFLGMGNLSPKEILENEAIDREISRAKKASGNLSSAANKHDIASIGIGTGFAQVSGMSGGNVASLNLNNGSMQGGIQSGVSYSHNQSRNYSYGINASGGSTFASLAHSAGIGMQDFAAASSAVAAAGQMASAASMVLPGGALGRTLGNIGAISPQSAYAMGVGGARMARSKSAESALNSANSYMDRMDSFRSNTNIGQLKMDMDSAHKTYLQSLNTPNAAMAKKSWLGAQRSYNNALNTEKSLQRQYHSLSPEARKYVDNDSGGYAGGGVEKDVNPWEL